MAYALNNKDIIRAKVDEFDSKGDRVFVIADLHIPFHDQLSIDTALDYADKYKPTKIVILGDLVDFFKISRFPDAKKPGKKSVGQELTIAKEFLEELKERYKCKIIYYEGNHEQRLSRYILNNASEIGELVENLLPRILDFDKLGITYLTRPFQIGRLNYLHGHEKPSGSYNPEYVTNVIFKVVLDHFICGHFHRNQTKTFKGIGKSYKGISLGYLAGELDWAIMNSWNRGFATVIYDSIGNFRAEVKELIDGEVY